MKNLSYKQCRLYREWRNKFDIVEKEQTVSYIPAWAAVPGNRIQILSLHNTDLFWTVESAGEEVPASFVKDQERGYKEFQGSLQGGGIDE